MGIEKLTVIPSEIGLDIHFLHFLLLYHPDRVLEARKTNLGVHFTGIYYDGRIFIFLELQKLYVN